MVYGVAGGQPGRANASVPAAPCKRTCPAEIRSSRNQSERNSGLRFLADREAVSLPLAPPGGSSNCPDTPHGAYRGRSFVSNFVSRRFQSHVFSTVLSDLADTAEMLKIGRK